MRRIAPYIYERKASRTLYFRYRLAKPIQQITQHKELKVGLGLSHREKIIAVRVGTVAALLLRRYTNQITMKIKDLTFAGGTLQLGTIECTPDEYPYVDKILSKFSNIVSHLTEKIENSVSKTAVSLPVTQLTGSQQLSGLTSHRPETRHTIEELFDKYFKSLSGVTDKTRKEYLTSYQVLKEILSLHEDDINYLDQINDDISAFVFNALKRYPVNRNKSRKFRELDIKSAISLAKETEVISSTTVNKHMDNYSKAFGKSVKRRWFNSLDHNFFQFNRVDASVLKKTAHKRINFTPEELQRVFSSEQYKACSFDHSEQYWIPLLLRTTGSRVEEIAQLHCKDIKQIEGIWTIDHNLDGDNKKIKTECGERLIPIHDILIKLGFLDFVEGIRKKYGEQSLIFRRLTYSTDHGWSRKFVRWMLGEGTRTGYLQRVGVKQEALDRKDNHAFRHTLSTELQEAGVSIEHRSIICGHSTKSLGENSTYSHGNLLPILKEAIETLPFSEIVEYVAPYNKSL